MIPDYLLPSEDGLCPICNNILFDLLCEKCNYIYYSYIRVIYFNTNKYAIRIKDKDDENIDIYPKNSNDDKNKFSIPQSFFKGINYKSSNLDEKIDMWYYYK